MNKQYNVDDILLEIKSKKSKQPAASVPAGFPLKKAEPVKAELPKEEPVKAEAPKSTVQDDFFLKFKEQELKQEAPKPVEAPKAEENNVFSFNKAVTAQNSSVNCNFFAGSDYKYISLFYFFGINCYFFAVSHNICSFWRKLYKLSEGITCFALGAGF